MISEKIYYTCPSIEIMEVSPEKGIAGSGTLENYRNDYSYDNDDFWDR